MLFDTGALLAQFVDDVLGGDDDGEEADRGVRGDRSQLRERIAYFERQIAALKAGGATAPNEDAAQS